MAFEAIVPKMCKGCAKMRDDHCAVILEPIYFWVKYKKCFARTEDKDWWAKVKKEVEIYAEGRKEE